MGEFDPTALTTSMSQRMLYQYYLQYTDSLERLGAERQHHQSRYYELHKTHFLIAVCLCYPRMEPQ